MFYRLVTFGMYGSQRKAISADGRFDYHGLSASRVTCISSRSGSNSLQHDRAFAVDIDSAQLGIEWVRVPCLGEILLSNLGTGIGYLQENAHNAKRPRFKPSQIVARLMVRALLPSAARWHGGRRRECARQCVLACWNMMIPYLAPELPEAQKAALHELVTTPLVYSSVAVRIELK